jgi:hypothetical protein
MKTINFQPNIKQFKALEILKDKETTELFYGGGAGGGKTYLGCSWLIISSLQYPGSRWAMCRAKLKILKQTTLLTFFDICRSWGLERDNDYKYITDEKIVWNNTTEIYLKDLFFYPSDPEFDSLGSTEFTGGYIDECSEVTIKSKNILMSRLRYKLDEFGIIPKLLITSNPAKNFLYTQYYMPYKQNKLPVFRKFIPALVQDNPKISKHYIENLRKLDEISKQRLLYGNFEYDDDPSKLMDYKSIVDLWTNKVEVKGEQKYISCDVARMGVDSTVIIYWEGMRIVKIWSHPLTKVNETIDLIDEIRADNGVQRSHIIVDEDGVGGGVVDLMENVIGFVNNSKPIETKNEKNPKNYSNLKTQCYFLLADKVNRGEIQIKDNNSIIKELLIQDLEQVKQKDIDKDEQRIRLVGKEEVKENIGRSCDYSDAMMMRMYFELKSSKIAFGFV